MIPKRIKSKFLAATVIFLMAVMSCSDGDSGSGNAKTQATVTATSSGHLVSMATAAVQLTDLKDYLVVGPGNTSPDASGAVAVRILSLVRQALIDTASGFKTSGATNITIPCNQGGNYTMAATWQGPDNPTSCAQIQDLNATLVLSDCHNNDVYGNGTVSFEASGVFCAPTAIAMQFDNVSLDDPCCDLVFEAEDLELTYSNIQDLGQNMAQMTVSLDGSVIMERGNGVDVLDMEFSQYSMQLTQTSTTTASLVINGGLRGPCLDGWITVETLSDVLVDRQRACPVGGSLRLVGNGQATIVFYENGSVSITIDDVETRYDSCLDLPRSCP